MCLYIESKPVGNQKIIRRCYKVLRKRGRKYYTPYKNFKVPADGVLSEEDSRFFYRRKVEGKHIHAWMIFGGHAYVGAEKEYESYAINVKAYGRKYDLVCKLLYIPSMDKVNDVDYLVKELQKVIQNPSWEAVRRLFPNHLRSMPSNIKVDWDKVFNEAKILPATIQRNPEYNATEIQAKLLNSRQAVSTIYNIGYNNFMDRFRKAYKQRQNAKV